MVTNGEIPLSSLAAIGNGLYLAPGFATVWGNIVSEVKQRYDVTFTPTYPDGAYRSYARQQYWYSVYKKYGRPIAAIPGHSNHGLGVAVDIYNHGAIPRGALVAIMNSHNCTPDPTESWHFNFHGDPAYGTTPANNGALSIEGEEMTDLIYWAQATLSGKTVTSKSGVVVIPESMWYQEKPGEPIFPLSGGKGWSTVPSSLEYNAFLKARGYDANHALVSAGRYAATTQQIADLIDLRGIKK